MSDRQICICVYYVYTTSFRKTVTSVYTFYTLNEHYNVSIHYLVCLASKSWYEPPHTVIFEMQ